jgi:hypothetical protein
MIRLLNFMNTMTNNLQGRDFFTTKYCNYQFHEAELVCHMHGFNTAFWSVREENSSDVYDANIISVRVH